MGTEIASLYAAIGASTKDFDDALRDTDKKMSGLDKTTNALGVSLKAAFAVGVAGAVAFGAAIGKTVKMAADFEQGVADIGAMMTLTDDETVKLADHIMDLGLDPNLKVSAGEAQEAIMSLGTAGLTLDQIMNGASEATVLLANATGGAFGDAASIATDVMAQFNITAEDMQQAVNQITGTTVASKFSIQDYQLAIGQAGGVAGMVGVTFEDFNAYIAATSSSFNSGSDAATSFKTFLQRLVPTTNDAKEAMIELGLSTGDDVVTAFFNANGSMKSAEEIAGALQTAFSGLSDAQKNEAASTIFGTDAMRTALSLASGGTAIIQKMKGEIGKVDAEELAAKRMDTFKGAMEIAWGVIETLSISIGQKFLPVLRPLVETFTQLAQTYGPSVIAFFGQVAERMAAWIEQTRQAVTGGMGPFVEKLKQIWEIGTQVVKGIGDFIDSFTKMYMPVTNAIAKFMGWKDVLTAIGILLAGPILAAIGGFVAAMWPVITTIAAVTAAVAALRWAWQNDFMGIQTYTRNWLNKISNWFFVESGIWQGTWEETISWIGEAVRYFFRYTLYNFIVGNLANIREGIRFWTTKTRDLIVDDWAVKVRDAIAHWASVITFHFNHTKDLIIEAWNKWVGPTIKDLTDWISVTKSRLDNWVTYWKDKFLDWKDDLIGKFEKVFGWFKPREWWQKGVDIVQGLWDGMGDVWERFMLWWNGVWGKNLTKTVEVKMQTHSPSKVMEKLGGYVVEGFAIGADEAMPMVYGAMDGLATASMSAGASAQPSVSTSRIEELLTILIAELRAKNMSANVTVAGGDGYGMMAGYLAGARR